MKKFSTIFVAIILLSVLVFFGLKYFWQNRDQYFFQGKEPFEVRKEVNRTKDLQEKVVEKNDDTDMEKGDEEKVEVERPIKEYEPPEIEESDCDNRCKYYEEEDLEYCKEICGLSTREIEGKEQDSDDDNESDDKCSDKKGFERDTCYKWRAIEEKNVGLCDKISDEELGQNCENRVIEELIP